MFALAPRTRPEVLALTGQFDLLRRRRPPHFVSVQEMQGHCDLSILPPPAAAFGLGCFVPLFLIIPVFRLDQSVIKCA